jgi:hypothetical protein
VRKQNRLKEVELWNLKPSLKKWAVECVEESFWLEKTEHLTVEMLRSTTATSEVPEHKRIFLRADRQNLRAPYTNAFDILLLLNFYFCTVLQVWECGAKTWQDLNTRKKIRYVLA